MQAERNDEIISEYRQNEYLNRMKYLAESCEKGKIGKEEAHISADYILLEILRDCGLEKIADAFETVPKWYA